MSHPALDAAVRLYLKAKGRRILKPKQGSQYVPGAVFAYEKSPDRFVLVEAMDTSGRVRTLTKAYGPEELAKRLMIIAASSLHLRTNPKRKPKKGSTPKAHVNRPSQTTKRRPTKRLKKRREKNIAQGRTGSYPNPVRVIHGTRVRARKRK